MFTVFTLSNIDGDFKNIFWSRPEYQDLVYFIIFPWRCLWYPFRLLLNQTKHITFNSPKLMWFLWSGKVLFFSILEALGHEGRRRNDRSKNYKVYLPKEIFNHYSERAVVYSWQFWTGSAACTASIWNPPSEETI